MNLPDGYVMSKKNKGNVKDGALLVDALWDAFNEADIVSMAATRAFEAADLVDESYQGAKKARKQALKAMKAADHAAEVIYGHWVKGYFSIGGPDA